MKTLMRAVLVLAAVGATGAWFFGRGAARPSVPSAPSSPFSTPAERAEHALAPSRRGCDFTVGQRFDVPLSVSSLARVSVPTPEGPREVEVPGAFNATARFEVLDVKQGNATMLGELAQLRASGSVPAPPWGRSFLVEVEPTCEVVRYGRHTSTSRANGRLEQGAVWELAWRWTGGDEQVQRHNARGAFTARVTTARVGAQTLAQRRVETYTQLWLGGAASSVNGFVSVTAGDVGWFDRLESEETLVSSAGQTVTRVQASSAPAQGSLDGVDRELAHYVWEDLLPKATARREPMPVTAGDRALREVMKAKTPSEAVSIAEASFQKDQNLAAAWPPLRAYLEARPEQTPAVVAELRAGQVGEDGLNPFFIALGNARTPEAKDALLGIMRDGRAPPTVRTRAMFSLVDRADVGVELAEEFKKSAQALETNPTGAQRYVAEESLLALTTMAGIQEADDVGAVALDSVRATLRVDPRSQRSGLLGLANLGDPALLPEAEPYTHSPDERVRRGAAKVIRRMRPMDTDTFIREWLAREPSLLVKKDIFTTLELQHFDAKVPAGRALALLLADELASGKHAVIARKALIRLVGGSEAASEPRVRALLKEQVRQSLHRRDGLAGDAMSQLTPDEMREVAP